MTEFDSDPWLFSEGGFTAAPVEIVNLAGGAVTETLVWRGLPVGGVPALPLLAAGVLAAGLLGLASRRVGGR
jgi:hypothetical protein